MSSTQRFGLFALLLIVTGTAGCDDQIKRVPWFKTMNRQASVETYEAAAIPPADGSVPLGAAMHYDLRTADTLLTNPVAAAPAAIERGRWTGGRVESVPGWIRDHEPHSSGWHGFIGRLHLRNHRQWTRPHAVLPPNSS